MFRSNTVQRWLVAMLCIVLLSARVGGAHLHLCFDGLEPPVSMHLADEPFDHHEPSYTMTHHDEDISLIADAIAKSAKPKIDVPPMLLAALLILLLVVRQTRTPFVRRRRLQATTVPAYLLPPLRGPPLTAFC